MQKKIISYFKATRDRTGRMLRTYNIQSIFKLRKTISNNVDNPKDKIKLEYCQKM